MAARVPRAFGAALVRAAPQPTTSATALRSFATATTRTSTATSTPSSSPRPRAPEAPRGIRASAPAVVRLTPRIAARWSSSSSSLEGAPPASESKIYNFEDIRALTTAPAPKPTLVDVREPGELASTGRIPGALNMPVKSGADGFFLSDVEFADRFGFAAPPKDKPIVFYCKSGVRSRAAATIARHAGWTDVGEYPGSWSDWSEKGGEVEK